MNARTRAGLSAAALALAAAACGDGAPIPPAPAPGPAPASPAPAAPMPELPPAVPARSRDVDTPPDVEWVTHGEGAPLREGDDVLLHSLCTLVSSGKVLLDTRAADNPLPHQVGSGNWVRAIDLVLPRLRVGDRVKMRVRSDLAWGDFGVSGLVPRASTVDFDIEVVGINPAPTWEVVASGSGRAAETGKLVTAHVVAKLADGTVFQSTREDGAGPIAFRVGVGEVIDGWDRVVVKMRVGDRWKIHVPFRYAHGVVGLPPDIPPRADLDFDLEVLSVDD